MFSDISSYTFLSLPATPTIIKWTRNFIASLTLSNALSYLSTFSINLQQHSFYFSKPFSPATWCCSPFYSPLLSSPTPYPALTSWVISVITFANTFNSLTLPDPAFNLLMISHCTWHKIQNLLEGPQGPTCSSPELVPLPPWLIHHIPTPHNFSSFLYQYESHFLQAHSLILFPDKVFISLETIFKYSHIDVLACLIFVFDLRLCTSQRQWPFWFAHLLHKWCQTPAGSTVDVQ